jgi:hypothetical protein
MNDNEKSILVLIKRLENIAKRNRDEFRYRMEFEINKRGELEYWFTAVETADDHTFVEGVGSSIVETISNAMGNITDACSNWNYTE